MPLYEYECDSCGHRFEVIQKFSDGPITECPKCQSAVRKLFSSPAIQFKGTGWYITDYAKKSGTAAGSGKNEGGGEKSGEKSGDKSGEKSGEKSEKSGDKGSQTSTGGSSSGDTAGKSDSGTKTNTPSS